VTDVAETARQPLKVAAAQARTRPGDISANVATAAQLVRFAASAGADVVVLPELFLSGYDLDLFRPDVKTCDIVPGDIRLGELQAACYSTRTVAVVGAAVRRFGGRTISLVVVGRDGDAHIAYDRQHLWREEREVFRPGDHGCTIEIAGWRLGLGSAYDVSFPEHVRAAVHDGCDAYLCPGVFTRGDSEHRRDLYFAARALENTCYTVVANHIGDTALGPGCGRSAVYGPDGRVVIEADGERVDVVSATFQDIEIDAARECLTMLDDLPRSRRGPAGARRESIKLD
jgi:predicted amidohydrolase